MGYTHYWKGHITCDATTWNQMRADFLKVKEASGVPLAGPHGAGLMIFQEMVEDAEVKRVYGTTTPSKATRPEIAFNGEGEDSYESFNILYGKVGERFSFCKTAQKKYDILVAALLMIVKHYNPEFSVGSDGNEDDWLAAIQLCQAQLGYGVYPCTKEE